MKRFPDPLAADLSAEPAVPESPPADAASTAPPPGDPGGPAEPGPPGAGGPAEAMPPSDADLIAASGTGDAAAYGTLYRRHVSAAHGLARQLVRGRAEADDVVAETFAKIWSLLHRGGGPDDAFRPYLLTAVRRAVPGRHRAARRPLVTDKVEAFDRGVPFADAAVADLERTMIARAFVSLPGRWQAVLWHTEIEGARPGEVTSLLGLTANGVAALADQAREGLRRAYLQMYLSGPVRDECRPVAAKLGACGRGGLAKRDAATVAAHLDQCAACRRAFAELGHVNVALKAVVAPIVLGPAAAAYLASAVARGPAGARIGGRLGRFRRASKGQQAAAGVAAGAVAVAGLAAASLALTGHSRPAPGAAAHRALPPAAAGNPAASASPSPDSASPAPSASRHPGSSPSSPGFPASGSAGSAPGSEGAPGSWVAPASSAPGGGATPSSPPPPAPSSQPSPPARRASRRRPRRASRRRPRRASRRRPRRASRRRRPRRASRRRRPRRASRRRRPRPLSRRRRPRPLSRRTFSHRRPSWCRPSCCCPPRCRPPRCRPPRCRPSRCRSPCRSPSRPCPERAYVRFRPG